MADSQAISRVDNDSLKRMVTLRPTGAHVIPGRFPRMLRPTHIHGKTAARWLYEPRGGAAPFEETLPRITMAAIELAQGWTRTNL